MRAFPYFGSKTRLAPLYDSPLFDTIVEPFCGAAAYSQRYWQKQIYIFDLNPTVIACWQFLIAAKSSDILRLPDCYPGQDISELTSLSDGERALLQFYAYDGFAVKGRRVGKRCIWNRYKPALAEQAHHFDHWRAFQCGYETLPNGQATWFIDPPYQFGGENYDCGNAAIDFQQLAHFCRTRQGQVIVCENMKATWLPFRPLAELHGIKHTTVEAVWP